MQKSKIDWCDYTWNPVTGCLNGCKYCYARKISNRFTGNFLPAFHANRLEDPIKVKKPQNIFVCSMADLFGDWVSEDWINAVFDSCELALWHNYLFLTKNPKRYSDFFDDSVLFMPKNFWLGTTIESQEVYEQRGRQLRPTHNLHYFLSLEPLFSDIEFHPYTLKVIKWVILGEQTNPAKPPKDEWVQHIIDQCREANIPVFVKSPLYERFPIQEYPEGLNREEVE